MGILNKVVISIWILLFKLEIGQILLILISQTYSSIFNLLLRDWVKEVTAIPLSSN